MAALPQLAAERQLLAVEASSMPHVTEKFRKGVMSKLIQRAGGRKKRMTAGEALATLPIPVVYEPVKGGES